MNLTDFDFSNRPTWELQAMKKARTMLQALNTERENQELYAIKKELRKRQGLDKSVKK